MAINTNHDPHSTTQALIVPSDPIWRLSVDQYHDMIRTGILTEDDLVELLDGWLVTKMVKSPQHSLATQLARDVIALMLPDTWFINVQEPITTADSEPEPDIAIVRGQRRDYTDHHPSGEDVALVLEVADATLRRDRTLKQKLYARAGIPTYWILNLAEQQLEVHSQPSGGDEAANYQQHNAYSAQDQVPVMIEGQIVGQITVRDLLP
jgi:Uma2 family endonuclease